MILFSSELELTLENIKKMNKLIIDVANEKIFLMIITNNDIYNIISGNRKRDRKLNQLLKEDEQNARNQEEVILIREHFTDVFFTNTLQIPADTITLFITSCIPKNIIPLFHQKRYLDITDIFLIESSSFTTKN